MTLLLLGAALAGPAYDQLKLRDGVDCAALGEATEALRDELLALSAPGLLPASVPMRAAQCLAERFGDDATVQAEIAGWPADPARPGQVLVLLARVDSLPEPLAVGLVRSGLAADNARVRARALRAAEASVVPAIHALAVPEAPGPAR